MEEQAKIVINCAVYKVTTLADGGLRVYLDMPESQIQESAMLMECNRQKIYLRAEFTAVDKKNLWEVN